MIVVGDILLSGSDQETKQDLTTLMHHPLLAASSISFAGRPVVNVSTSPQSDNPSTHNSVYVFQREYAVVDPKLVKFVGSDEATTCVCFVIRNRESGMTSVAHMDSPRVVDGGLTTLLSSLADQNREALLDVHVVGGFDDGVYQGDSVEQKTASKRNGGYSLPLVCKIVEALKSRQEKFYVQTFCVLRHNTRRDSEENILPIITGVVVETSTGVVCPANFERSTRCPDEIVRRLRVAVSSSDPKWKGKLLETYDTQNDMFWIAPCSWSPKWKYYAISLQNYSDNEILHECSTSPLAESPDFIKNERSLFDYMIKYPDWNHTFPKNKPRIFKRIPYGGWMRLE